MAEEDSNNPDGSESPALSTQAVRSWADRQVVKAARWVKPVSAERFGGAMSRPLYKKSGAAAAQITKAQVDEINPDDLHKFLTEWLKTSSGNMQSAVADGVSEFLERHHPHLVEMHIRDQQPAAQQQPQGEHALAQKARALRDDEKATIKRGLKRAGVDAEVPDAVVYENLGSDMDHLFGSDVEGATVPGAVALRHGADSSSHAKKVFAHEGAHLALHTNQQPVLRDSPAPPAGSIADMEKEADEGAEHIVAEMEKGPSADPGLSAPASQQSSQRAVVFSDIRQQLVEKVMERFDNLRFRLEAEGREYDDFDLG